MAAGNVVGGCHVGLEPVWSSERQVMVGLLLTFSRVIHRVKLPRGILESKELAAMGFCVNKLLIL